MKHGNAISCMIPRRLLMWGFVAVLAVSGCSKGGGPRAAVTVKDFKFELAEVTVKKGTAVTWTNQDTVLHTVTSGQTSGPENSPDGLFKGNLDGRGKTFSYTFDKAGTFTYYCSQHNVMTAAVKVT